jgi:hypothetical protein
MALWRLHAARLVESDGLYPAAFARTLWRCRVGFVAELGL